MNRPLPPIYTVGGLQLDNKGNTDKIAHKKNKANLPMLSLNSSSSNNKINFSTDPFYQELYLKYKKENESFERRMNRKKSVKISMSKLTKLSVKDLELLKQKIKSENLKGQMQLNNIDEELRKVQLNNRNVSTGSNPLAKNKFRKHKLSTNIPNLLHEKDNKNKSLVRKNFNDEFQQLLDDYEILNSNALGNQINRNSINNLKPSSSSKNIKNKMRFGFCCF